MSCGLNPLGMQKVLQREFHCQWHPHRRLRFKMTHTNLDLVKQFRNGVIGFLKDVATRRA